MVDASTGLPYVKDLILSAGLFLWNQILGKMGSDAPIENLYRLENLDLVESGRWFSFHYRTVRR